MEVTYNCWHGCHKKSEGCLHCYVFRCDESIGKDSNLIYKTKNFNLPIQRKKNGEYRYPSGTSFLMCFSSDFLIEEADDWRKEVLSMIKERKDCHFLCITKRPERIKTCISDIATFDNLALYCTMENQKRFDERLAIYLNSGVKYKGIMVEPMLGPLDLSSLPYKAVEEIGCGGESGDKARTLDFKWVQDLRKQAKEKGSDFYFHQTGACILVNDKEYLIPRRYQHSQTRKAFKD